MARKLVPANASEPSSGTKRSLDVSNIIIPTNGGSGKKSKASGISNNVIMEVDHNDLSAQQRQQLALVDLRRLLHVMEQEAAPLDVTAVDLRLRAERLASSWQHLRHLVDDAENAALQVRIDVAVARAQQVATARQQATEQQRRPTLLQRIFYPQPAMAVAKTRASVANGAATASTSASAVTGATVGARSNGTASQQTKAGDGSRGSSTNKAPQMQSPADLQAAQREQMETAIGQMARQLKQETHYIHTTLQHQSRDLNELETVAAENVQQVSHVAQNVQAHVQAGWARTFGTWAMLIAVAIAFALALLTIQMAPKYKNGACMFWCPVDERATTKPIHNPAAATAAAHNDLATSTIQPEATHPEADEPHVSAEHVEVDAMGEITFVRSEDGVGAATVVEGEQVAESAHAMDEQTKADNAATAQGQHASTQEAEVAARNTLLTPEKDEAVKGETHHDNSRSGAGGGRGGGGGDIFSDDRRTAMPSDHNGGHPTFPSAIPLHNGRPFGAKDVRTAANEGNLELLQEYLQINPALVNRGDHNGWTAVHLAARRGQPELLEVVLRAGGQAQQMTKYDQTALHIAQERWGDDHAVTQMLHAAMV